MNYKNIVFLVVLLVPTVTTPAIWLRKDPQAIIEGQHNFFFPFLKEENVAIVRSHTAWTDEILAFFADKIKNYPTSESAQGKDPKLVAEAQAILKKEYQQLMVTLGDPLMTALDQAKQEIQQAQDYFGNIDNVAKNKRCHANPTISAAQKQLQQAQHSLRCDQIHATQPAAACATNLSPEQRKSFDELLKQTNVQLFGEPLMKTMMVGIQGPKLEDFKRRAHIEDVYAAHTKELNGYKACTQLSQQDKNLIKKALAHINKAYNEVLDSEGLKTATMMESV